MREYVHAGMSLYGPAGGRKYLGAAEWRRFLEAAGRAPPEVRLFCLLLRWSGGRISEVLALTPASIDVESGVVSIFTLKRRARRTVRQVPLPPDMVRALDRAFGLSLGQRDPQRSNRRLWDWSRTTAWRRVKEVMAQAGIAGASAMPRGLRHSFGVSAFQANVPPIYLVQRWLGRTLRTTAIYGDVIGPDERIFAARMWTAHGTAERLKPVGAADNGDRAGGDRGWRQYVLRCA